MGELTTAIEMFRKDYIDPPIMTTRELKEEHWISSQLMRAGFVGEEIKRLRDNGVTIILTTQYLEEADELADRISIIDNGLVAAEGTPDELKALIEKFIVNPVRPVVISPKQRAARGSRKKGDQITFTKHQLERLLNS